MSWFDAAGLANIAKSALKEAQRTIDKALDINEEAGRLESQPGPGEEVDGVWGSFAGSFFDHTRQYNKSVSLEGLDDAGEIDTQQFSQSKLVVEGLDAGEGDVKDLGETVEAITVPPSRNTNPPTAPEGGSNELLKTTNVIDIPLETSDSPLEISTDESVQSDGTVKNTSDQLENLLAEAISDKEEDTVIRETSPLSSDKSDLVKIGSGHTSGHTSADELETTTSSDIEIISSPNGGDSSSTQSRHSPQDVKQKPIGDKVCLEERMSKKIAELTELLESRQSQLIETNRKCVQLEERLEHALCKQAESHEYAQRMSALERKFQQAIGEKDNLRAQLEQERNEAKVKSQSEVETAIGDKEETIRQLREEGEKLSKQQLQHTTIIKKLRAKEKENEVTIKQLKEKIDHLSSENERLQRTVGAKEEVERTQIEAVNQLTQKTKKLETDVAKLQGDYDDLTQKYETTKRSLEAARKELNDKNKITNQLTVKEQLLESLENEKRTFESRNEEVIDQLHQLRCELRERERDYANREAALRAENKALLERLEEAERRNEQLSESVLEVSKPLTRQLDSLQAAHRSKIAQFDKIETELTTRINELQFRLNQTLDKERALRDESAGLRSRLSEFESATGSALHQKELAEMRAERLLTEKELLEKELTGRLDELTRELNGKIELIDELRKELDAIKSKADEEATSEREESPTLSVGKHSVAESTVSSIWSQIEAFDHAPRFTNVFEIQTLQTNLQQREGEVQQLQWELTRREQERNLTNAELASMTTRIEELERQLRDGQVLKRSFDELREQYDVLCQMYGEKVDEVNELKLDLVEAKEAYRSQLDELLDGSTS